ncbi:hypothetical protein I5F07_02805 [Proteus vulgaris]|uniref:tail fiber/spike domain-containing protein n=2 Tax=Proteus vulgaris TaxID=585 RepID=UPI0018C7237E|nr:hypothetical protein [Proteus vulgaris]MBG5983798.1 hypothetical protein [Proteus vulgaris]
MSTTPTQNPVPSEAAKDLKFNSGKIDEFVTSMKNKYIDRFGKEHFTIEGLRWIAQQAISQFGYITLDSFQKGVEITLPNQVLRDEVTGEYYRWDGALPKIVPVDSTPESSGGIGVNAWMSIGDASLRSEINVVVRRFKSLGDIISNLNLKIGDRVSAENYYENGNSGELFFTVVPAGTGIEDGGKFVNLLNGLQLKQNIKMPLDPRAWGAVGDGNISNATKDTKGLQGAVNYGAVYINDGKYYINRTTSVTINNGITSSRGAVLHYINDVGECIYINDGNNEIADTEFRVRIIDGGKDRVNSWSVVCDNVARSLIDFEIIPSNDYQQIYGSLSKDEKLDLKFGLRLFNNSYSNSIESKLFQSTLRLESPDNNIVEPAIIWSNNRRFSVYLLAASNLFSGVQIVPGNEAGIYSPANDMTHLQIIGCYFDGNTRLQSDIATGTPIKIIGSLRRSVISDNRFFIPAMESINIGGSLLASTLTSNFFSNGDSADTGVGDIIINHSSGSVISSNTFFRNNAAEKTGKARVNSPQSPVIIKTALEYDEPTIVSSNSLSGNSYYSNSLYPEKSAVITKNNHSRINNYGTLSCRYTDNQDLKCYKTSLTRGQLDNLGSGEIYVDTLSDIGVSPPNHQLGYVKTTIVQNINNLEPLSYGKQEIILEKDMLMYVRIKTAGVWSSFRQI